VVEKKEREQYKRWHQILDIEFIDKTEEVLD
jgi:hypothetical protein